MLTNISRIIHTIQSFYNFKNKRIIHVGAGGGALIEYATEAKNVAALDISQQALNSLVTKIENTPLQTIVHPQCIDFMHYHATADLVYFEFSLHETQSPKAALDHALTLAPEILIVDHQPDSPWSWATLETEKLHRSSAAINNYTLKKESTYEARQSFTSYEDLIKKVNGLGQECIQRIATFQNTITPIDIAMPIGLKLITKD